MVRTRCVGWSSGEDNPIPKRHTHVHGGPAHVLQLWDTAATSVFSVEKKPQTQDFCFTDNVSRCWACQLSTKTHLSEFSPTPSCFLAYVSKSRTWSVYKFGIKALIVGFLFQSVMPFWPQEVQSFYQVFWDQFDCTERLELRHSKRCVVLLEGDLYSVL